MKKEITLTVIITTHSESVLIHRTLRSVNQAIQKVGQQFSTEVILHADNPTSETSQYITSNKHGLLKEVKIFQNSFGDLGASRNFAIQNANGKYIATIDADDLMSKNWLVGAVDFLEKQTETTIAHSEVTVEFEGADSLIIKHGEIDHDTDALLSVYANRWNSVIVAPRQLLLEEPYATNSPGYGYEDWHLNCRLIDRGVRNVLIPETAIFVRRKKNNSEWLRQIQSMAVLRANPLLSFRSIRSMGNPFKETLPHTDNAIASPRNARAMLKETIKRYPLAHRSALRVHKALKRQRITVTGSSHVPEWLQREWRELHHIERQIFPTPWLMAHIPVYDTLTYDHKRTGALYKAIVDQLHHDTYDYLLFVPWLIRGGADKYAINYANTIAELYPDKHVLVIATLPVESIWANQLNNNVDFVNFGTLTREASNEIKHRLLGHLIENGNISNIHILNSELGYDFVALHKTYLTATDRNIVVTSFSQSVDVNGRLYGYSHTHVPLVYDQAKLITSDNKTVLDMWIKEYGFDPKKLQVHRQPVTLPANHLDHTPNKPLRILWAARIAPEKRPELISQIGNLVGGDAIIDMYGSIEHGCEHYIKNLPPNVVYKGGFNGFSNLPLQNYDALLYTSAFDGMPNTILEAASYKLPIVASSVGGIPEFIVNQKTGLLIENVDDPQAYANAINSLATNTTLMRDLGQAAYNKLETDFSAKAYKKQITLMLEQLKY